MDRLAGGGSGGIEGSVPFPTIDLAALWEAGSVLSTQAKSLAGSVGSLEGAGGRVGSWSGQAAAAWHADVKVGAAGLDDVSQRLGTAGRVLSNLFDTIEQLQNDYTIAAGQELAARQTLARDAARVAAGHPGPSGLGTVGLMPWVLTEQQRIAAIRAEQQAVDEVHSQAGMAANRLAGLVEGVPNHIDVQRGSGSSPPGPSRAWIVLLLGSIADNRLAGLSFQNLQNLLLGLKENTENFKVWTRLSNGTYRWVGTRPDSTGTPADGDDDGVSAVIVEIKNTGYQHLSTQIRAEMQLAENEGVPFQLIVPPGARLSSQLEDRLDLLSGTQGGVPPVIFSQGDGVGTDPDGQEYTANPVTHQWEPVEPGNNPPSDGGSTAGPSGGDDGGNDPDPDPEPGPVDPIEPVDPFP